MIKTEFHQIISKKVLGLTFVLSAAAMAFAQEKASMTGSVVDKQKNPVPYASVTFKHRTNKIFNDAVLADEKGRYKIALVPGTYEITIEAINYKNGIVVKEISGGEISAFVIEMEPTGTQIKTKEIEGVVIKGEATKALRVEIDKKVYDPSTDLISKGGTLQDVLQNVPSVAVETDGTVSMRGSSNVKFLINGKPSSLLGIDDGTNALQSIPADSIERIEVISNPSSKFEASGTAGILNIILKKDKKIGFNGNVTGSIGYIPQTSLNTNLSWRKGDITVFLNGGGGYRENRFKFNNDISYKNASDGDLTDTRQYSTNNSENKNYNVSSGFSYTLSEKSSLSVSGALRGSTNEGNGIIDKVYMFQNAPSITSIRTEESNGNGLSYQGDATFDTKLDDKGQLLIMSLSLQRNQNETNSLMLDFANDKMFQKSITRTTIGKIDYEKPLGEKGKLEMGYRLDINDNDYLNDIKRATADNPTYVPLAKFSNDTSYKEMFNAFYVQYKNRIGEKIGYQLGVRDEHSKIDIDYINLEGTGIVKEKNYNNIFPSVYVSYDIAKGSQFLLNYSKRIDRPRSFFMVPYGRYSNPESLFEGNIDLDPSFVDSFEFGYSLQKKKATFNPTLYYRRTTGDTKMVQYRQDESDVTVYIKPVNLGTDEKYGLDLNFTYDPISWLKFIGGIDLFGYRTEGLYTYQNKDSMGNLQDKTRDFSGNGFSSRIRLNSTIKFDKTFSVQLQGNFRGGQKTATSKVNPMYFLNIGASKTVLDGNGTLTFSLQDTFNTRNRTMFSYNEDFNSKVYMQFMPRQVSLSFSYRFKQGAKIDQPKPKKNINSNATGEDDGPM